MNTNEIMANILSHNACPEGVAWARGKDSNAFWGTSDIEAAPYLFWIAAKNADLPGWKTNSEIQAVLKTLVAIAGKYVAEPERLRNVFARDTDSLHFFNWMTRQIGEAKQPEYYAEILSVVKELRNE
jgi:hypothetical protein